MRRNPRAKWTLPDVIDPPERICFQIEVPKNVYHLAAFRGALLMLSSAIFWQDDPAHTAKQVALVWRDIVDNVNACAINPSTDTGITLEALMSTQIRISPDDSCIIQMWCIDHWEDWYDPRACIAENATQSNPQGELDPGDCQTFHVALQGNSRYLLPIPVDDGYSIQISNASGGWFDGNILHAWNCPSGLTYALGVCVSAGATDAGSPIPSLSIGRLIAEVDGVFYDAFNATIVVPPGTGQQNMYFQMNDSNLADNQGSISFDLTVCATPNLTWCHEWLGGAGIGTLVVSNGVLGGGGTYIESVDVGSDQEWASGDVGMVGTITDISMVVDYNHTGAFGSAGCGFATDGNPPQNQNLYNVSTPTGSGTFTVHWSGSQAIGSAIKFFASSFNNVGNHTYIRSVVLHGTGVNPFASSNCT